MKRRSLTLVLCLLATLSLVSVGFASWVISAGDVESATGSFVVEIVTDERLEIKNVEFDATNFSLTAPENATSGWLQGKDNAKENLDVVVTFDLYQGGTILTAMPSGVTLTAAFVTGTISDGTFTQNDNLFNVDDEDPYYAASTSDKFATIVNAAPTISYADGKFTCTLQIAWGNYFGSANPYTFYNAQDVDAYGDEALAKLTALNAALANVKYQITISAQYANA